MPPKFKNNVTNPDAWWQTAYQFNGDIDVQFELKFNDDLIKPGNLIKIKNQRGQYKFRCLAHNVKIDVTWIDCLDSAGAFCSFPIAKLVGLIKPKRSRRMKPSV